MAVSVVVMPPARGHHCIYDDVQREQRVHRTTVNYQPDEVTRARRGTVDPYQPIRITTIVQDEEQIMDSVQVERLETIMGSAVSVIRKLLAVYPVSDALILERSNTACRSVHSTGPNAGKCGSILPTYQEECLDKFVIPDDHLGGLWTWDAVNPDPITHFPVGNGLANTDTVLYVKAEHTSRCDSGGVYAYASYCKLDQFNRPIAGVINFCPGPLLSDEYDEDKFILLALHEIFHVLGFSSSLFDKFQICNISDGLQCEQREDVTSTSNEQTRLKSPAVLYAAQTHFGCYEEDWGAPLEDYGGSSSHWEMRHMFGSLMAPTIQEPHSTFIDNMTLAVMEDSGWYRVNYDYVGDFLWGKSEGCDFGSALSCATNFSDFFCNGSAAGCDYLGLNKATCSTNDYLDSCRVFWPDLQALCTELNGVNNITGETPGSDSRCFRSNALKAGTCEPGAAEGRCYATRCSGLSEPVQIQLFNADWVPCPEEAVIQVPGYDGVVHCPPAATVCTNGSSLLSLVEMPCLTCSSSTVSPSPQTSSKMSTPAEVSLSLEISDLDYSEVDEETEVNAFSSTVKNDIAAVTRVQLDRIEILQVVKGSVIVTVCITERVSDSEVSAQEAYNSLQAAVSMGEFSISYNHASYNVVSISLVDVSTLPPHLSTATTSPSQSPPHSGPTVFTPLTIVVLSVMTVLLAVIVIAVCVCKKKNMEARVAPAPPSNRETAHPGEAYVLKKAEYNKTWKTSRDR
ncbi:ciliated left-right organizer metallopeptidase-like [Diadema antillarum]|uniref:ciliated left-right organizer metallopeptidase-like n=1 Tax=Diadema antillarum TaxID=105358 RepID=UPI003A887B87